MLILVTNIHYLLNVWQSNELLRGKQMQQLPTIENAYLVIKNGIIEEMGSMNNVPEQHFDVVYDAKHASVLPTCCDSHTHIVFAKTREQEFVDKLHGLSYADIAARGGGILNSAAALQATSEQQLYEAAKMRIEEVMQLGTGAIENKSGYGLTVADEIKMLRVIQQLKASLPIPIKATFLGAHAIPLTHRNNKQGYIELVINEKLPIIAKEQLADFVDVFC
jgi:imidazolonepropionase